MPNTYDLFERFQVLQANVRAMSHIVQNQDNEPTIDELDDFAHAVENHMIELSSLRSDIIEHYFV